MNEPLPVVLRPIQGVAWAAVVMLTLTSSIAFLGLCVDLWILVLIGQVINDPMTVDHQQIMISDTIITNLDILGLLSYVLTAVAFLVWLYRARDNARVHLTALHRHGRPWLLLGWFVPPFSLWFPKQIVDDIWNTSAPDDLFTNDDQRRANRPFLVRVWWAAWLVAAWGAPILIRYLADPAELPTPQSLRASVLISVAAGLLQILAAALAVQIILRVTALQEARNPRRVLI